MRYSTWFFGDYLLNRVVQDYHPSRVSASPLVIPSDPTLSLFGIVWLRAG